MLPLNNWLESLFVKLFLQSDFIILFRHEGYIHYLSVSCLVWPIKVFLVSKFVFTKCTILFVISVIHMYAKKSMLSKLRIFWPLYNYYCPSYLLYWAVFHINLVKSVFAKSAPICYVVGIFLNFGYSMCFYGVFSCNLRWNKRCGLT